MVATYCTAKNNAPFSKKPGVPKTDRRTIDAQSAARRYKFEPRRG